MTVVQASSVHDVSGLDSPAFGERPRQGERCVQRGDPADRQVCVQQFLQHLGRCDQTIFALHAVFKEIAGRQSQRVVATNGVHEDVGVDEDHVVDAPLPRDSCITWR